MESSNCQVLVGSQQLQKERNVCVLVDTGSVNSCFLPAFISPVEYDILKKRTSFTGLSGASMTYCKIVDGVFCSVFFIGIGYKDTKCICKTVLALQQAVGIMIRLSEKEKLDAILCVDNSYAKELLSVSEVIKNIASSAILANYEFVTFFTIESKKNKKNCTVKIYCPEESAKVLYDDAVHKGFVAAQSTNNARVWCDMPPCHFYPEVFAKQAVELLSEEKTITCKVLHKKELEEIKAGGILAVGGGSAFQPCMVVAEYVPKNGYSKTIALVGKGVTFDTGGISIKPADNMEDMKDDMAGAAVVLNSLSALAKLECPYRIIACAPMVENMPSGSAFRPGDIVTFYNGKTAEIKNTDAEGRLILADALSYVADKYKPDAICDFATLTGACAVAVGPFFAAVMTQYEKLAEDFIKAGKHSGDRCWQLPLDDAFKPAVESDVADVCNIGKRQYKAGTITAGWFLKAFVPEAMPWIHVDIASVAFHPVNKSYLRSSGASGFGVRLCLELLSTKQYFN